MRCGARALVGEPNVESRICAPLGASARATASGAHLRSTADYFYLIFCFLVATHAFPSPLPLPWHRSRFETPAPPPSSTEYPSGKQCQAQRGQHPGAPGNGQNTDGPTVGLESPSARHRPRAAVFKRHRRCTRRGRRPCRSLLVFIFIHSFRSRHHHRYSHSSATTTTPSRVVHSPSI